MYVFYSSNFNSWLNLTVHSASTISSHHVGHDLNQWAITFRSRWFKIKQVRRTQNERFQPLLWRILFDVYQIKIATQWNRNLLSVNLTFRFNSLHLKIVIFSKTKSKDVKNGTFRPRPVSLTILNLHLCYFFFFVRSYFGRNGRH